MPETGTKEGGETRLPDHIKIQAPPHMRIMELWIRGRGPLMIHKGPPILKSRFNKPRQPPKPVPPKTAPQERVDVKKPNMQMTELWIRGRTPLVIHKFRAPRYSLIQIDREPFFHPAIPQPTGAT